MRKKEKPPFIREYADIYTKEFLSNKDAVSEIVLPPKGTITREDVFGDSDRDTIYQAFSDAISPIANLGILGIMGHPANVGTSKSILYRILYHKKFREEAEKAYVQDGLIRKSYEKAIAIRDSSLYGQACWLAYKENSTNNTLNFGIYYAPGAASRVPNIEQVEYQLNLILTEAIAKGKTIFRDEASS